jgi:hypothetical protein
LTDPRIVSAYWFAGRAVHRVVSSQPIIELELISDVFDTTRREVNAAIATPPAAFGERSAARRPEMGRDFSAFRPSCFMSNACSYRASLNWAT